MKIKFVGEGIKFHEFTCNNCKSVIEYTDNEVEKEGSWVRTGMEESTWYGHQYLVCPVCKVKHVIKSVKEYY